MRPNDFPPCEYCHLSIPPAAERCPHCGRPGLFANVRTADLPAEVATLDARYASATNAASARGLDAPLKAFEGAVMKARATLSRSTLEVQRLATSDHELYASYYQLTEAGVRLPGGEVWDALRQVADCALFTSYREHIKFAALTLDDNGLVNYGDCSLFLRESMIAHRASAFEENSVLFMDHKHILMSQAGSLPEGYRSSWTNRGKLCVAKLADRLDPTATANDHAALLMKQGTTSAEDEFVEIHIWGPITIRSFEQVTLRPNSMESPTVTDAVRERLKLYGVEVTE